MISVIDSLLEFVAWFIKGEKFLLPKKRDYRYYKYVTSIIVRMVVHAR